MERVWVFRDGLLWFESLRKSEGKVGRSGKQFDRCTNNSKLGFEDLKRLWKQPSSTIFIRINTNIDT